jgi:hypothetical protein
MVLNVFMQTRSFEEGSKSFGFAAMMDGTAQRPYVYRRLVPLIANFAEQLIPAAEQRAFVEYHFDRFHLNQIYFARAKYSNPNPENWTPAYAIKFHTVYLILFSSLIGMTYCLRFLVETVFPKDYSVSLIAPLAFLTMLPLSFLQGDFFYDFPELLLLSALLLAAFNRSYTWWLVLLPLAVLNKESNVLVPLLYAPVLLSGKMSRKDWGKILVSVSLSLAVYWYVSQAYAENSGGATSWQLPRNIEFWSKPKNYLLWADLYAPMIPFPRGANLFLAGLILSMFGVEWRSKPRELKQLLCVAALVNIPLLVLFCHEDEMRNLSFLFIPAYLVCTHSLKCLTNRDLTKRSAED